MYIDVKIDDVIFEWESKPFLCIIQSEAQI